MTRGYMTRDYVDSLNPFNKRQVEERHLRVVHKVCETLNTNCCSTYEKHRVLVAAAAVLGIDLSRPPHNPVNAHCPRPGF